jgi:hypothetical protein
MHTRNRSGNSTSLIASCGRTKVSQRSGNTYVRIPFDTVSFATRMSGPTRVR